MSIENDFSFEIRIPTDNQLKFIQGIWSAESQGTISRWFQGDGCSGMLFILSGSVQLEGRDFDESILMLPHSNHANAIKFAPQTIVAGIRFQPSVSFSLFGEHIGAPTVYRDNRSLPSLSTLMGNLKRIQNEHINRINLIEAWASSATQGQDSTPLFHVLQSISFHAPLDQTLTHSNISQRQLERQCRQRVGMTLKEYQRVLRVNEGVRLLKSNIDMDLAEAAFELGFSDQAHMTREFKRIAKITPGKLQRVVLSRESRKVS